MAPRKQKSVSKSDPPGTQDSVPSGSQDASQDIDDSYRQKLKDIDKKNVKARRRNMENDIRESHNHRFAQIHQQMKEYSDAHEKRLDAIQRPQIERLQELIQRKLELEKTIGVAIQKMETDQENARVQLSACMNDRVNKLRGQR